MLVYIVIISHFVKSHRMAQETVGRRRIQALAKNGVNGLSGGSEIFVSIYLLVIGAVFGSFATLVGERVPLGESFVHGRSHCIHCGHQLRAWELVPIVSWLALRGHCATCKAAIPILYPAQECMLGLAVILSFWRASSPLVAVASCILWFLLAIAMTTDLTAFIVPNWLTYSGTLCMYLLMTFQLHSAWRPLIGMLVGGGMIFLIYVISGGKMGLGDAKLYLSIGAFLGSARTVESFLLAAIIGAVVGGTLRLCGRLRTGKYIPFVPFIVCGVALTEFLFGSLPSWYLHSVLGLHIKI